MSNLSESFSREEAVTYSVRIVYREPTFDSASSRPPTDRAGCFTVKAHSTEEARARALSEFHSLERLSSVG
jgi:hypothetical protein